MGFLTEGLRVVLVVVFVAQCSFLKAQSSGIKFVRNKDKSVTFSYSKNSPGSLFVVFKLTDLKNTTEGIIKTSVYGHGGQLTTLHPTYKDERIDFSYSPKTIKTFLGDIDAKPDLDFKYVLPVKHAKKVELLNFNSLNTIGRYGTNKTFYQFDIESNDTVFSARKGVVVQIKHGEKLVSLNKKGIKSKEKASYVVVEHEDGTLAKYSNILTKSYLVKVGDTVFPTSPLAVVEEVNGKKSAELIFSVYHLSEHAKEMDFFIKEAYKAKREILHLYAHINPSFYITENQVSKLVSGHSYSTFYNNDIVTFEMTKREKKQWEKKNTLVK